jgi:hypothetical protein
MLILSRFKFSEIHFTKNPTDGREDGGLKRENIGCIQLTVEKRRDVKEHGLFMSSNAACDTSATKIWKKDKKIADNVSLSTRYSLRPYVVVSALYVRLPRFLLQSPRNRILIKRKTIRSPSSIDQIPSLNLLEDESLCPKLQSL